MTDAELLERGRRLKRSIDGHYKQLTEALSKLSALKETILSEEKELRDVQNRLLRDAGVSDEVSSAETLRRKVAMNSTDADELP